MLKMYFCVENDYKYYIYLNEKEEREIQFY